MAVARDGELGQVGSILSALDRGLILVQAFCGANVACLILFYLCVCSVRRTLFITILVIFFRRVIT